MFAKRWVQWLTALVAMAGIGGGVGSLLIGQGLRLAGILVLIVTSIILHLWFAGGIFARVQARWVLWMTIYEGILLFAVLIGTPLHFTGSTDAAVFLCGIAVAMRLVVVGRSCVNELQLRVPAVIALGGFDIAAFCTSSWSLGFEASTMAICGIAGITILFIAGLWLIRAALSGPRPVFGVAHTLIDEAIRMKIALIFIVVLIMIIPVLPVLFDSSMRLQYQMQTFLAWSLTVTVLLMGLMTIFLSCATICSEIDRHQIYLTITKPVSRAEYLFGKWLGIMLLNLLLLLVLCAGIYTFARVMQATGTPRDAQDWSAIKWQVLTARESIRPSLGPGEYENMSYLGQSVSEIRQQEQQKPVGGRLSKRRWEQIRQAVITRWHTVPHRNPQRYVFRDMGDIRQTAIDAKHRRERAQIALLKSLASSTADPVEAEGLRQWADGLSEATRMRSEAQRLRAAAEAEDDADVANRMGETSNKLLNEGGRLWGESLENAGPFLGDLGSPSPAEFLQLRFKPQISQRPIGERVLLAFQINGRPYATQDGQQIHSYARDNYHVVNVPAGLIDQRGTLELHIANITEAQDLDPDGSRPEVTVSFAPGEGLEILVTAGSFEGNLLRSALIIWAGLCFLAMMGLAAGTFLGFPVACMLSLLVFVTTVLSGYVDDSIFYFGQFPDTYDTPFELVGVIWTRFADNVGTGKYWEAAKIPIGLVGKAFVTIVPSFSDHNPIPLLTDGRIVGVPRLTAAWLRVGLFSTAICWMIAWLVFRGRELARVTV